nr:hypothetical protein [uncultured bacterium]
MALRIRPIHPARVTENMFDIVQQLSAWRIELRTGQLIISWTWLRQASNCSPREK